MESKVVQRVVGLAVLAVGLLLAYDPELVTGEAIPEATFEAVERRIVWGVPIGIGILLLFHFQLTPWLRTVAAVGCALTLGLLIARLLGIAIDGSVARQWYWVGVEFVMVVALALWYARLSR